MQKMAYRGCLVFLAILLLISAIVPVYAVGEDYTSRSSFFSWASGSNDIVAKILGHLPIFNITVCPNSSDGQHHSDSYFEDRENGYYTSVCVHCGKTFTAHASDLSAAYDDYVSTLPASGYTSDGSILWSPKVDYWFIALDVSGSFRTYYCPHYPSSVSSTLPCLPTFDCSNLSVSVRPAAGSESITFNRFVLYCSDAYPIDGYYIRIASPAFSLSGVDANSSPVSVEGTPYSAEFSAVLHYAGIQFSKAFTHSVSPGVYMYFSAQVYPPVYKVTPFNPSGIGDTYSATTRPTSITGGNYGIVGDNGQITKVEDNSTIINETNNTYYNPATGQTVPITGWSYDYSDRSYKVTMEGGKTSTVTYGDENISITETTINESGDTITNNYTIYYLIGGSGSETPPSACDHTWTETSTTPATCTLSGSKLSTCSKCRQTKTESIPALGHNWQVKQTVTTQYDESGQLTQQGYTIFECSTCHEQYKSTDGTAPPGGGSGTDPGGEEKETIWQKIGKLFGIIGDGVIGMIEAAVGKVLDGLISLAEMLVEKLETVVETVLSIFDELPLLFGGFLDFLTALFPFLPPELMTILTFGVIAIVFIGIIKAVRR